LDNSSTWLIDKEAGMDFVYQRSYRGPLKAVILDWAGTTIDFGSFAPVAVFLHLFERHGISISK
jgi:phosphonoacetaldehyde hydrolase